MLIEGYMILFLWYVIGLLGSCLAVWYRYKKWGYSVTLGVIAFAVFSSCAGAMIWFGLVLYWLIEIIDWNKPIIRGHRDRY